MTDRIRFLATFRAVFDAQDDVEAQLIVDRIIENASVDLVADDDSDLEPSFECTQIANNVLTITPQEVLTVLRKARNLLIKTRRKTAVDAARELDMQIHAVDRGLAAGHESEGYDYGHFLDVCEAILKYNEVPIV